MSPCGSSILPSIVGSKLPSGEQPCHDDGILELAASSRHSTFVTKCLVVSYTTFSPLLPSKESGFFLLPCANCHQLLVFSQVERSLLPGLSSRACFITSDKTRALPIVFFTLKVKSCELSAQQEALEVAKLLAHLHALLSSLHKLLQTLWYLDVS